MSNVNATGKFSRLGHTAVRASSIDAEGRDPQSGNQTGVDGGGAYGVAPCNSEGGKPEASRQGRQTKRVNPRCHAVERRRSAAVLSLSEAPFLKCGNTLLDRRVC